MAATAENKKPDVGAMFEQAVKMYEEAARAGLHAQEEAVKWYTEALGECGGPAEWQERAQKMLTEAVPTMQQNVEEAVAVMNRNAEAAMTMLKKAYEAATPGSLEQIQERTRSLWEQSLGVLRENTQSTLQMNARLLDTWAKLARGETVKPGKV